MIQEAISNNNVKSPITIKQAMEALTEKMNSEGTEPGTYASAWHCNLAMLCSDAIYEALSDTVDKISNDAADKIMKLCFDIDTKK